MAQLNFQADHNDLEQSFDVIPAEKYPAIIETSEYISTKAKTGMMLKLTYQIIDGVQKGRKIFEQLNLENPSKQAEQIARKSLNSICKACQIIDLKDSSQLHNIPMLIDVRIKEDSVYGPQNVIKKHEPLNNPALSTTGAAQPQQQPQQVFAPTANAKPPWAT